MKTGEIKLSNKEEISKILNKNNLLLSLIGMIFILIDYDLFNSDPKLLITKGFLFKGIAIAFQLIFIYSLFQWQIKKKKTINILADGHIIKGKLISSERIKSSKASSFYLHLFEYSVNNHKYEVVLKNKNSIVKDNYVIYEKSNPKNSIVFQDLKKEIKKMIKKKIKNIQ